MLLLQIKKVSKIVNHVEMTEDQTFQEIVEKIPRKSIMTMIGFVQRVKMLIFRGEKDVISVQPEETVIIGLKEIKNGAKEIDI